MCLCLKTGTNQWITEEIPVICGKGTKWFTMFKFKHGEFNYVKVWFFHRYHVSLVKADLVLDGDKFRTTITDECELKVFKGRWNRGPVYYKGEDVELKLCGL